MKIVLQRVKSAKVSVDDEVIASIGCGLLLLVGFCQTDSNLILNKVAQKISKLRMFEDQNGKTNLGLAEVGGEILSVSQFTLYGDVAKGNRPSFTKAATAITANDLYHEFNKCLETNGLKVSTGQFQAMMNIELINDGPFTLVIDSEEL